MSTEASYDVASDACRALAAVATLADLRDQMIQPKILTIYLTANITLDGRELPAVEKQLRLLGACGSDGFATCTLDANKATRHVTAGPSYSSLDCLLMLNHCTSTHAPQLLSAWSLTPFSQLTRLFAHRAPLVMYLYTLAASSSLAWP